MINTNNFSNFFPGLITKLTQDLDNDKVFLDEYFKTGWIYILAYSISEDKFFLSIDTTFDKKICNVSGSDTFDIDLIPLFRLYNGEFSGFAPKIPTPQFKERIKSVIEKDTVDNNLLIDKYWGISFFEQIEGEVFKKKETFLLKSLLKKVQYSNNNNVFEKINLEHPFYKHLTNLLKIELENLDYEKFLEVYDTELPSSFFSKKDNGGFIKGLFGSEFSNKLMNNLYKVIKDDNLKIIQLYNRNPDLNIWCDYFGEFSSKFLFNNRYEFSGDSKFELFVAKKLLEQGKPVLFEHSDFSIAIPFLDLIEDNPTLAVKITDGVIGELVDLLDYYDEDRLDYFGQQLSDRNLYVPICLPEDEQKTILEYYEKYSKNERVEIAEFWADVVVLLSSYKELLDAAFFGTLDLESVIQDEFQEQYYMDMELESYYYR